MTYTRKYLNFKNLNFKTLIEYVPKRYHQMLELGMVQHQRRIHREPANVKLYRFWDFVFLYAPIIHGYMDVSCQGNLNKSPQMHKIWDNRV